MTEHEHASVPDEPGGLRPETEDGDASGGGAPGDRQTVRPPAIPPTGSEHTPGGTLTKDTPGYGTSQGASGATSGGADPGGAVRIPRP